MLVFSYGQVNSPPKFKNKRNTAEKMFHSFYCPKVETNSYKLWLIINTIEPTVLRRKQGAISGSPRHRLPHWQPPKRTWGAETQGIGVAPGGLRLHVNSPTYYQQELPNIFKPMLLHV